jgi:hypothetical protein
MGFLAVMFTTLSFGLGLSRDPYIGVACPHANSTTCGRVGIAVWLARRHAIRIDATLAGAHVRLIPPRQVGSFWLGYVRLPLERLGVPAHWEGNPPKRLRLTLRIRYGSGLRSGTLRLELSPGWG